MEGEWVRWVWQSPGEGGKCTRGPKTEENAKGSGLFVGAGGSTLELCLRHGRRILRDMERMVGRLGDSRGVLYKEEDEVDYLRGVEAW